MRKRGLKVYLVALVLGAVLPLALFAAGTVWWIGAQSRAAAERGLADTARALALAADAEVRTWKTAALALAASPSLQTGEYARFYGLAREVGAQHGGYVVLFDTNFQQIVNTLRPFGTPLPKAAVPAPLRAVLDTGEPNVSDRFLALVSQRHIVAIDVPVLRDGEVVYVLNLSIPLERLQALLDRQTLAPGWVAGITDSQHTSLARWPGAPDIPGRKAQDWYARAIESAPHGIVEGHARDRTPYLLAFQRLTEAPRWTVGLAPPLAEIEAASEWPALLFAGGAAALLALSLLGAALTGQAIAGPVRALVGAVPAVLRGEPLPAAAQPRVREFAALDVALREAAASTRATAAAEARARALAESESALRASEQLARDRLAEIEAVYATAPTGMCVLDTELRFVRINERLAAMNGHPAAAHIGRHVRDMVPDLTEQVESLLRRIIETGAPVLNVELAGETPAEPGVRRVWNESWLPLRDRDGRIVGLSIVAEEVTARKAAERRQALMMHELDHRAKNLLAVVQGMMRLTRADSVPGYLKAVQGRIAALARAHTLLADGQWDGADLEALVRRELAPFTGDEAARVAVEGPRVLLAPAAVQPLAMAVHELATNAVKHGALSAAKGRVAVTWRVEDGTMTLRWQEQGGPPAAPPARNGFGAQVIEQVVRYQLDGEVIREWPESGLVCTLRLPASCLAASGGGGRFGDSLTLPHRAGPPMAPA